MAVVMHERADGTRRAADDDGDADYADQEQQALPAMEIQELYSHLWDP